MAEEWPNKGRRELELLRLDFLIVGPGMDQYAGLNFSNQGCRASKELWLLKFRARFSLLHFSILL